MIDWTDPIIDRNKELKQKFKTNVGIYRAKNNIQIKCISDRILLYLRYGMDADPVLKANKQDLFYPLEPIVMELYHKIRGDPEYTCRNPVGMASAILYIASVMDGLNKTQKDIAEIFGVSEVSIRNNYLLLKKKLNL